MKNKVIWIVNQYNGPYNSVRTRQTVLSQYLTREGYDVYLICGSSDYKGGPNYINSKVKYILERADDANFIVIKTSDFHNNYERVLVAIQFQGKIWNLRKKLPQPDVIISNFAGLFGNVFLKWKRKYSTRLIFDILDFWPEGFVDMGYLNKNSPITKVLYRMEYESYKKADGIIFSVQGGKQYIIDKGWDTKSGGKVDISKVGYLNNGVDLISVDIQRKQYVLDDPDLNSDKFKVIYLGSLSAFNGLDVLVETAKVLQEQRKDDIVILIYGYGNQEEKLRQMAKGYHLKNIKFKGALDKKYAMNLLSRGDLNIFTFVNTPLLRYGTSPNKLFMYFASGKPVLSMIKPAYDLVEKGKCGISVENDPHLVAEAINEFYSMDKEKYQFYCRNARKTAVEYDYKNLVKVMIDKIRNE